jgi:hypothetical protein
MSISGLITQPRKSIPLVSIISFCIIIGICAGSASLLSGFLRNNLLQRDAVVTQELVQSIAYAQNVTGYFNEPADSRNGAMLEAFFQHITQLPDVLRTNVFARDGRVRWSSEQELVGKRFEDNDELFQALSGELVIETGEVEEQQYKSEHVPFAWRIDQWFVESYIPIRDRGLVVGVVELYKVPRTLSETIANSTLIVWASVLLAGILFYAVLFWLATGRSGPAVADDLPASAAESAGTGSGDHGGGDANATDDDGSHDTVVRPINGVDTVQINPPGDTGTQPSIPVNDGREDQTGDTKRQHAYPPLRWTAALVVLAAALFGPVALGVGVLYIYGVADEAPLSGIIDPQRQSPLAFSASLAAALISGPSSATEPVDSQHEVSTDAPTQPVETVAETVAETTVAAAAAPITPISPEPIASARSATTGPVATKAIAATDTAAELLFWESVKNGNEIAPYQAYLDQFPQGTFAGLAKLNIQKIELQLRGEVKTLLVKARQAFERRALTTPADDNAVRWAEAVLLLDPNNVAARGVIASVIDTYLHWTTQARESGNRDQATNFLQKARSLDSYATAEQLTVVHVLDQALQPASTSSQPRLERRSTPRADPAPRRDSTDSQSDSASKKLFQRLAEQEEQRAVDRENALRGYSSR